MGSETETNTKQGAAEEVIRNEISTMTKLNKHPNVVKLIEVIDDPHNS